MRLLKYIFLVFLSSSLCFCDADLDVVQDQEEDIKDYLDDYDIDYDDLDGVYRYVPNSDREDYDQSTIINKNDELSYYYESYTFDYGKDDFISTNKDYIIQELIDDYGLNAENWSTNPIEAILGKTELLEGVTKGLEGCRQGDSVVIIMTSDYAYGKKQVGVIEPYSAIMYIATIQ